MNFDSGFQFFKAPPGKVVLNEAYQLRVHINHSRSQRLAMITMYLVLSCALWKCRLGSAGWFFWSQQDGTATGSPVPAAGRGDWREWWRQGLVGTEL